MKYCVCLHSSAADQVLFKKKKVELLAHIQSWAVWKFLSHFLFCSEIYFCILYTEKKSIQLKIFWFEDILSDKSHLQMNQESDYNCFMLLVLLSDISTDFEHLTAPLEWSLEHLRLSLLWLFLQLDTSRLISETTVPAELLNLKTVIFSKHVYFINRTVFKLSMEKVFCGHSFQSIKR